MTRARPVIWVIAAVSRTSSERVLIRREGFFLTAAEAAKAKDTLTSLGRDWDYVCVMFEGVGGG